MSQNEIRRGVRPRIDGNQLPWVGWGFSGMLDRGLMACFVPLYIMTIHEFAKLAPTAKTIRVCSRFQFSISATFNAICNLGGKLHVSIVCRFTHRSSEWKILRVYALEISSDGVGACSRAGGHRLWGPPLGWGWRKGCLAGHLLEVNIFLLPKAKRWLQPGKLEVRNEGELQIWGQGQRMSQIGCMFLGEVILTEACKNLKTQTSSMHQWKAAN